MFNFTDEANIGKDYKGFILLRIDNLIDYKCKAVYLRHKKTGLEIYHILNGDKENLFSFGFRTIAKNSKGAAHILEHSTLCGSEKYPLKEPFTTLASQSLNTFLNALTYPDKTVYPGSSVVPSDYFTMMDVYADAVFFPLLDYNTFIQEGHRLELDEKDNLSIQGVVYNEMKGSYGSFYSVAIDEQIKAIFPESYPAFDSGGSPSDIPTLTYEEFKAFHQKFYNPNNCLLFLSGNIPTETQIDFLDEKFMGRLEKKFCCNEDIKNYDSDLPIINGEIKELQKFNFVPKSQEIRSKAPATGATGLLVTMNWYSGKNNLEKLYLSEVLCGNDSSPLAKKLKDSKLGDDLAPIYNNYSSFPEEFFSYGLSGVKKGDEEKVYKLIQNSIREIYEKGIPEEEIQSAIMGIDFALREVYRYMGGPYWMHLMNRVYKSWNYGLQPDAFLFPITEFEKIKQRAREDKNYTNGLIKKYLIDPAVCVKVVIEPDDNYFAEQKKIEQNLIERLSKNLDKNKLKDDLKKLHEYQQHEETQEELSCIPYTKLKDLTPDVDEPKIELEFIKGADGEDVPIAISKEETNGIFYLDVLFPHDRLDVKYYQHLPFLSNVITNLGWNGKKWDACITESAQIMGDVWGRLTAGKVTPVKECQDFAKKYESYNFVGRKWLTLTTKALISEADASLKLFAEIISTMSFDDKERFKSLLVERKAEAKAGLVGAGRDIALKRACALISESGARTEVMWGLSQYKTIRDYKVRNAGKILETYKYIYEECRKSGAMLHVTADEESLKKLKPLLKKFAVEAGLSKLLPVVEHTKEEFLPYIYKSKNLLKENYKEKIQVKTQTGYAAAVTDSAAPYSKELITDSVFASWFSLHTLWDKIRTTGGAYGASAYVANDDGKFIMVTYRDPSPEKSVSVFKESLQEMKDKVIPEEDIERTIVSAYGDELIPLTPRDRGGKAFAGLIYATPHEVNKKRVETMFSINSEDVSNSMKRLADNTQKFWNGVVFCDKSKDKYGKILKLPL